MSDESDIPTFPFIKVNDGGLDVLILPDPDGGYPLGAGWVRMLCDWCTGFGVEGVLRIVPWSGDDVSPASEGAGWFVEYWGPRRDRPQAYRSRLRR